MPKSHTTSVAPADIATGRERSITMAGRIEAFNRSSRRSRTGLSLAKVKRRGSPPTIASAQWRQDVQPRTVYACARARGTSAENGALD